MINAAAAPLNLDPCLADHERAVVTLNRIGRIVQIVSWTVHGDLNRALHDINLLDDDEVEALKKAAEWIRVEAEIVLDARRTVGEEIGVIVIGAGPVRPL